MSEIKEKLHHIRGILGLVGDQETVNMAAELEELIDNQAQKAEELQAKVDELEKELKTVKTAYDDRVLDIDILDRENERYKQALEFYADERHYDIGDINGVSIEHVTDRGEKARQALKGVEG